MSAACLPPFPQLLVTIVVKILIGNDSNPWIAFNSGMSELPQQDLASNVGARQLAGSYAAEGMFVSSYTTESLFEKDCHGNFKCKLILIKYKIFYTQSSFTFKN